MSQLPNISTSLTGQSAEQPFGAASSLNDLDLDDFLDLMIAELQNQDPLNPLENDELVAQISQIREVGATERLTETLDAVLLGQNISSATNLIGAEIDALSDDGERITGVVGSISVADGEPKLHLDLSPTARVNPDAGRMQQGDYEYRVVWRESGTLLGVDPGAGGAVRVEEGDAVTLSNLPATSGPKQVYRREAGSGGPFRLAGAISAGSDSSYVDAAANGELSEAALTTTPQLITPQRPFSVSLKNVGVVRPPSK